MITHQKKTANAVGGKTARACESCIKKRASWFCPADDAFLCHACDSFVHSANELAGQHKRVRLGIASRKPNMEAPSWHQGFTKKARTPRNPKAKLSYNTYQIPVVPEVSNDDNENYLVEENEENDMVFSVPTFDFSNNNGNSNNNEYDHVVVKNRLEQEDEFNISLIGFDSDHWDKIPRYLPSENELADFTADVESLLEQEEAVKTEEDINQEGKCSHQHVFLPGVKIEENGESTIIDHCYFDWSIDVENEMLNFDLNYNCVNDESQVSVGEEVEEKKVVILKEENDKCNVQANKNRRIMLRLNYEEVINAWDSLGCSSPWTTGCRPEIDPDHDGWPNCMGVISPTGVHSHGPEKWIGVRGNVHGGDGGREARVSRYREKRRTRLFSKKIRYQVRKLNAEKRPRLKGRFVKRTSLSHIPHI